MTTKQEFEDFIHGVIDVLDHESLQLCFQEPDRNCEEHVYLYCTETEQDLLIAKSNEYAECEDTNYIGWSCEILATIEEIKEFIAKQKQDIQDGVYQC